MVLTRNVSFPANKETKEQKYIPLLRNMKKLYPEALGKFGFKFLHWNLGVHLNQMKEASL